MARLRLIFALFLCVRDAISFGFQRQALDRRVRQPVRRHDRRTPVSPMVALAELPSMAQHFTEFMPQGLEASARSMELLSASEPSLLLTLDPLNEAKEWLWVKPTTAFGEGFNFFWYPWRNLVQGSIVQLHDILNDVGIKENTWGATVILFTLLFRSLTLPALWIQYSSTEKTKALQPYLEQIKTRYRDPQVQNYMTAKLYDETDTNPLAGCLPSFLQLPLLFALYRSFLNLAKDQELDESFLWLPSLEGPTITEQLQLPEGRGIAWLTTGWKGSWNDFSILSPDPSNIPVPLLGWHDTLAYCSIPLALAVVNVLVQKLNPVPEPAEGEEAAAGTGVTKILLKYIPLIVGYFALCVPTALALYLLTTTVFTTAASSSIRAYLQANPPEVTWDYLENEANADGLDTNTPAINLDLPKDMDEALLEAKINARPPRASRRQMYPSSSAGLLSPSASAIPNAESLI